MSRCGAMTTASPSRGCLEPRDPALCVNEMGTVLVSSLLRRRRSFAGESSRSVNGVTTCLQLAGAYENSARTAVGMRRGEARS
jgi:hypothetical protein